MSVRTGLLINNFEGGATLTNSGVIDTLFLDQSYGSKVFNVTGTGEIASSSNSARLTPRAKSNRHADSAAGTPQAKRCWSQPVTVPATEPARGAGRRSRPPGAAGGR